MATTTDVIDTAELVSRLDLVVIFVLLIIVGAVALRRGWIYTEGRVQDVHHGYQLEREQLVARLEEAQADAAYWRSVGLRALGVAEQAGRDR